MKKLLLTMAASITLTCCATFTIHAGTWLADGQKWKYQNDDGTYAANGWMSDNGTSYYIDSDGYMLSNTMTPDGKVVGRDGKVLSDTEPMPDYFPGSVDAFNAFSDAYLNYTDGTHETFDEINDDAFHPTIALYNSSDYDSARAAVARLDAFDFTPYLTSPNIAIRIAAGLDERYRIEQTCFLTEFINAAEQKNWAECNSITDKILDSDNRRIDGYYKLANQLGKWASAY